jgi:hypothetical protein
MKALFRWIILIAAAVQFLLTALPPGNGDIIGVQSAALDLSRSDTDHLYPGKKFDRNDEWVKHSNENHRILGDTGEPQWLMYPPLYPWLLSPFASLGSEAWRLSWALLQGFVLFAFLRLLEKWLAQIGAKPDRVLLAALLLGSYPVARVFQLGQTSMLLSLLLWSGLLLSERGRQTGAWIYEGLAIYIKPFFFVAEFPRLLAKKLRHAALVISVSILLAIVTVTVLGSKPFLDYIEFLRTLSGAQTAFWGNQSLLGALLRIFSDLPSTFYGFEQDATLRVIATAMLAAFLISAAIIQIKSKSVHPIASPSMWLAAVLLGLSLSWEHHVIVLLPAVAFLWTRGLTITAIVLLAVATFSISINLTPFFDESYMGRALACLPAFGRLILFLLLATFHLQWNKLYKTTLA